jgi:hypothetical protein
MVLSHPLGFLRRRHSPRLDRQKAKRSLVSLELLEDRLVLSSTWVEQGPGPILNEFNVVIPNQNNVAGGAVAALAADPSDANIVWAAAVNGGVWKTTDAYDANPVWTPLTDTTLPFLSTNSIALSPLDPNTVFVGTGSTSSDASQGVARGIGRTTDGGLTWTVAGPINLRIRRVLATPLTEVGEVVLACTLSGTSSQVGVYRSNDGGTTYTRISGAAGSGLPALGVGDMVEDPGTPSRVYAIVPGGGASGGVYKSEDAGVTWAQVNTGLSGFGSAIRAKLAIHSDSSNDVVYAMFMSSSGGLGGVFRSDDLGANWVNLGAPSPTIFPGLQGSVHGSIVADPNDANVFFIAGDRQDLPFPNANGATSFSDNMFRGTFSSTSGTTWETMDENGSQGTSPHPDSRSMVFDANGNLLQSNDGGVYRLNTPDSAATRQWVSINGNLRVTEFHSITFDPLSKVVFGGTQDNGTPMQEVANKLTYEELQGGDGGVVGVDGNQTAHPGTSIRYTSSQFFGNFLRSTWDPHNNFLGFTLNGLNITSGAGAGQTLRQFDPNIQFYQPFVLNNIDPTRMMIGTAQFYESLNQGDSLADLGGFNGFFVGNNLYGQPMVYGGTIGKVKNPDVFYGGIGSQIEFREHMGDPLTVLSGYHGAGVATITMNPRDYRNIYVVDNSSQIWVTFDKGVTFSNITINLGTFSPQIDTLILLSPSADPSRNVLVAGGIGGVWALTNPTSAPPGVWAPLGLNMPHVIVQDLHFDQVSNLLVAGTLGRGAWTLFDPTNPTSSPPNIKIKPGRSDSVPNLDPQLLDGLIQVMLMGEGGREDPGADEGNPPLPDDQPPPSIGQSAEASSAMATSSEGVAAHSVDAFFGHTGNSLRSDSAALFGNPFASVL